MIRSLHPPSAGWGNGFADTAGSDRWAALGSRLPGWRRHRRTCPHDDHHGHALLFRPSRLLLGVERRQRRPVRAKPGHGSHRVDCLGQALTPTFTSPRPRRAHRLALWLARRTSWRRYCDREVDWRQWLPWTKLLMLPTSAIQKRFRAGRGRLIVARGSLFRTIGFGGGPLSSSGTNSLALARFDSAGNLLSTKNLAGRGRASYWAAWIQTPGRSGHPYGRIRGQM